MASLLNVFFNIDRSYFALVEPHSKGLMLKYIDSTEYPVDLENMDSEASQLGFENILEILPKIPPPDKIFVSFPAQNVFINRIPGSFYIPESQLHQLIDFEIHNAFPQFNSKDFTSLMVEFGSQRNKKRMLCCEIFSNAAISQAYDLLSFLNAPIERFDISQFNAHSALLYNYPENIEKCVTLLSFQDQFIDLSVIDHGNPTYYTLIKFNSVDEIPQILESEFKKIMAEYATYIETAYFCGSGLTYEILSVAETKLSDFLMTAKRLNAFRLVQPDPDLPQVIKDYCSRTQHIFPACIGAAIPPYHKFMVLK